MRNSSVAVREGLDLALAWASGRSGDRPLALHIYFLGMENGEWLMALEQLTINN